MTAQRRSSGKQKREGVWKRKEGHKKKIVFFLSPRLEFTKLESSVRMA